MAKIDLDKKIQKIGSSAYSFALAGDDVEIGDIKSSKFKPYLKAKRWGEECFFGIHLPINISKHILEGNKIKAKGANIDIHFYPLKPESPGSFGGAEFEVILKKKPSVNSITLNIEIQGLKFYYQPPLTEEEWPEGYIVTDTEARDENGRLDAYRPENVVGSYAVYHNTRTQFHRNKEVADKYKCGKAFHLYRPRLTDADGNKIWADLDLNEVEGTLTITVDQNWLDNAVYPVKVDPNFGLETKGATDKDISNYMYACKFVVGEAGLAQSLSWWVEELGSLDRDNFKVAIYDSDRALLSGGGPGTIPADHNNFFEVSLDSNPSLTESASYWLTGLECDVPTTVVNCFYDTVTGWPYTYKTGIKATYPENPLSDTDKTDRKFSVYCTYEAAAKKTLVQVALISIPPLIVLPTLGQILKLTGGC